MTGRGITSSDCRQSGGSTPPIDRENAVKNSRTHTFVSRALFGVFVVSAASAASCAAPSVEEELIEGPRRTNKGLDWRDQVIYQIMVDRFHNGDPNNDYFVKPSALGGFHGGDWQGVIDKLDYLEELGVNTLWISPVIRNVDEDAGFYSYHGYWGQDFFRPNPNFGDLYKLRELVDKAHERDILVVLDIVTNHVGQLWYYDINGNGRHDEWLTGGANTHTCLQICRSDAAQCRDKGLSFDQARQDYGCQCSADEHAFCANQAGYFERVLEADPEYDPRGVQGWTSLGFSGPSEIRFPYQPEVNRVPPPRPPKLIDWPEDRPWFDDPTWYNRRGRVYLWWHEGDYSYVEGRQPFVREQETLGDFPGGLKDLNTDNPDVQDVLSKAFEFWIAVADFDGFRIDTLKHIDMPEIAPNKRGFWGEFTGRMRAQAKKLGKENFFMFGEAFDGNDNLLGIYTFPGEDERGKFGRVDSVFYFSQKYQIFEDVIKNGGATKKIECLYNSRTGKNADDQACRRMGSPVGPVYYDQPHASSEDGGIGLAPQQVLVNFMDNHDVSRFLWNSDPETLHAALFYLLTWDGIPCIYYGTEQRFNGGNDPRNREDMALGSPFGYPGFDTTNETFTFVKSLIQARKDYAPLRRGEVNVVWATERPAGSRDYGVFAFERVLPEERALVVLNLAKDQESTTCAPEAEGGVCMKTSFPVGSVLQDVGPESTGETFVVQRDAQGDGYLQMTLPARSGRILVPSYE
ncbi:MAG: alpha-amylase [Deltaproteobacteria bacterium]|nr:alpha-amylase [Deltaproteobacteria bacterium]